MRGSLVVCVCAVLPFGCGDDDGGGGPLDGGGDDGGSQNAPDGSAGSGGRAGSSPDPAGSGGRAGSSAGSGGSAGTRAGDGAVDPGDDGGSTQDGSTDDDAGGSDAGGSSAFGGPLDITYAAEALGVDARRCFDHEVGADGTLESYTASMGGIASPDEAPTRGTCEATDLFIDAVSALGRLHDGTLGGEYYGNTVSFDADEGLHYALVAHDELMPTTGFDTYTLLAASDPTLNGGGATPGSVTGSAALGFTSTAALIALDFTVVVDSVSYHVETTGGTLDPSQSTISTYSHTQLGGLVSLTNTNGVCATGTTCGAFISGVIGGQDEERLAVAYSIVALPGAGGSGVQGVLLFEK